MDKSSSLRIVSLGCRFKNEYNCSFQPSYFLCPIESVSNSKLFHKIKGKNLQFMPGESKTTLLAENQIFIELIFCFYPHFSFSAKFGAVRSSFFKYRCNVWRVIFYILKACTRLQSPFIMQIIALDISSGSHCWRLHINAFDILSFCNECTKTFTNFYFVSEIVKYEHF
jgi:hypothetical protein